MAMIIPTIPIMSTAPRSGIKRKIPKIRLLMTKKRVRIFDELRRCCFLNIHQDIKKTYAILKNSIGWRLKLFAPNLSHHLAPLTDFPKGVKTSNCNMKVVIKKNSKNFLFLKNLIGKKYATSATTLI